MKIRNYCGCTCRLPVQTHVNPDLITIDDPRHPRYGKRSEEVRAALLTTYRRLGDDRLRRIAPLGGAARKAQRLAKRTAQAEEGQGAA